MPFYSSRSTSITGLLLLFCGLAAIIACSQAGSSSTTEIEADKPTTAAADIQWQSYENAVDLSGKQNKKVYLYFFADWCGYCTKMEETTFMQEAVIARLNRHFIPVRLKLEDYPSLAEKYSIRGVPASWFLEKGGKDIGGRSGYLPTEQFIELLDVVITEAYKK